MRELLSWTACAGALPALCTATWWVCAECVAAYRPDGSSSVPSIRIRTAVEGARQAAREDVPGASAAAIAPS